MDALRTAVSVWGATQSLSWPPTPEQAKLTAQAANAAGDVADSYYYMSEYHIMSGDLLLAVNQLQLALLVRPRRAGERLADGEPGVRPLVSTLEEEGFDASDGAVLRIEPAG